MTLDLDIKMQVLTSNRVLKSLTFHVSTNMRTFNKTVYRSLSHTNNNEFQNLYVNKANKRTIS